MELKVAPSPPIVKPGFEKFTTSECACYCERLQLHSVGEILADDLEIVAEMMDGLDRAEIQNRSAVGLPMIAVETENGGAGLQIVGRDVGTIDDGSRFFSGKGDGHESRQLAGRAAANIGHVVVEAAIGQSRGVWTDVGRSQLHELRLQSFALGVEPLLGPHERRRAEVFSLGLPEPSPQRQQNNGNDEQPPHMVHIAPPTA